MATNDPTTNYEFELPDVGSDAGSWGTMLNTIFGAEAGDAGIGALGGLDAIIKGVSDVADSALPLDGGTMTGDVHFGSTARLTENENTMSSGTEIDWANGNFFTKNLGAGNTTITFANLPSDGTVQFITVDFRQPIGGNGTVTWPTVIWQDDVAPTLSTEAYHHDIFTFFVYNGTDVVGAQVLTALDYAGSA